MRRVPPHAAPALNARLGEALPEAPEPLREQVARMATISVNEAQRQLEIGLATQASVDPSGLAAAREAIDAYAFTPA